VLRHGRSRLFRRYQSRMRRRMERSEASESRSLDEPESCGTAWLATKDAPSAAAKIKPRRVVRPILDSLSYARLRRHLRTSNYDFECGADWLISEGFVVVMIEELALQVGPEFLQHLRGRVNADLLAKL